MQNGLKTAINVPLTTMRLGGTVWDALLEVARYGNPASKSDTQVGARTLETGIWGAHKNVLINLPQIEDKKYKKDILQECEEILERAKRSSVKVIRILAKREE